jgi:hypothetical protein
VPLFGWSNIDFLSSWSVRSASAVDDRIWKPSVFFYLVFVTVAHCNSAVAHNFPSERTRSSVPIPRLNLDSPLPGHGSCSLLDFVFPRVHLPLSFSCRESVAFSALARRRSRSSSSIWSGGGSTSPVRPLFASCSPVDDCRRKARVFPAHLFFFAVSIGRAGLCRL